MLPPAWRQTSYGGTYTFASTTSATTGSYGTANITAWECQGGPTTRESAHRGAADRCADQIADSASAEFPIFPDGRTRETPSSRRLGRRTPCPDRLRTARLPCLHARTPGAPGRAAPSRRRSLPGCAMRAECGERFRARG